jgi:hypothetical protein
MPKRFYLRYGTGKTARVWLQGKGGGPYAEAGCGTLAEERRRDQRHAGGVPHAAAPGADRRP